jgi:hypothetical protein
MVRSSGHSAPNSAPVQAAIPPCRDTGEARLPVYVNGLAIHQTTLACRTPISANRWASSWEHTCCSQGIIGWASPWAGAAHPQAASCRASSCHVPSCCTDTRLTDVLHRPKRRLTEPLRCQRPPLGSITGCGAWSAMRLPACARVGHTGVIRSRMPSRSNATHTACGGARVGGRGCQSPGVPRCLVV